MAIKTTLPTKKEKITSKKEPPKKKVISKKSILKKNPKTITDDTIDIVAFDMEYNSGLPLKKEKIKVFSMDEAAEICPQGKQPRVIRDNPRLAPPVNQSNYIIKLKVKLSTQNVEVTFLDGMVYNWICSPNPSLTPRGNDVVGFKCGPKHTNYKRDGMAWFTALKRFGMAYGFHNSQRVGIGVVSHGCIRVSCAHAKIINQNSWSGKTIISIVR